MRKIKSQIINFHNLLLLGILVFALFLRLWGIGGLGLPRVGSINDEIVFTDAALKLLKQDGSDSVQWGIGQAVVYFYAAVSRITFALFNIDPAEVPTYYDITSSQKIFVRLGINIPYPVPEFYLGGRASAAILGGFSVVIIYLIGKTIKSKTVGLTSAFFVAANPVHVEHSHYITTAVPAGFLLLLAFYVILLTYSKNKWLLYLLSFALVYLAIYTKQNNLILLAPLGLALMMSVWREFQRRSNQEMVKYFGLALGVTVIAFILCWIFFQFNVFVYTQEIFNRIFRNNYLYGGYHFGNSGNDTFQWLVEQLFTAPAATWKLISFLAIPGILLAIKLKAKGWLLLSIFLPYLVMISFLTVRFMWWLIPALFFLTLLAGFALEWGYTKISQKTSINKHYLTIIFMLIIVLISGASIRNTVVFDYYASQPDIRTVASEWMQPNLPQGSKVIIDAWGPYLETTHHDVIYVDAIGDHDLQTYREEKVNYIVLNSINLSRLISAGSDPRAAATIALQSSRIHQIVTELPLERRFTGPALFNPPIIEVFIYKLQ